MKDTLMREQGHDPPLRLQHPQYGDEQPWPLKPLSSLQLPPEGHLQYRIDPLSEDHRDQNIPEAG